MTERLSTLLRDEVATVPVPTAPTGAILTAGRRLRRRRRTGQVVVVVALLTGLAAGVGPVLFGGTGIAQQRYAAASPDAAYRTYGAFSTGSTVHIGNHEVTFEEKIKALYYTSEGVLVRMGKQAIADEGGPSHYTLIHPDGSTKVVSLKMGDRVPGTDPDSPNVTYAEKSGAGYALVAVSLITGKEIARSDTVERRFTWGGWEAPPVTTVDHRIWALFDEGWVEFDWDSGTTRLIPNTAGRSIDAAHGVYADYHDNSYNGGTSWKVRDFATGRVLADLQRNLGDPNTPWKSEIGWLSPDGRYVRFDNGGMTHGARLVSVETGTSVSLPSRLPQGWTPNGHSLSVDPKRDTVTVCDPRTGDCDTVEVPVGPGKVKLGGASYES